MPDATACVHCKRVGLVRLERVIRGGQSIRAYYCGGCDSSWQVADDGASDSLRRDVEMPPDRSRPR